MDANDKTKTFRTLATILMVVGAALLAYSVYEYSTADGATTREVTTGTDNFFTGNGGEVTTPLILGLISLGIGAAFLFVRPNTRNKPGHYAGTPRSVP